METCLDGFWMLAAEVSFWGGGNVLWAPAVPIHIFLMSIQEDTHDNQITCYGRGEVIKSRMS